MSQMSQNILGVTTRPLHNYIELYVYDNMPCMICTHYTMKTNVNRQRLNI